METKKEVLLDLADISYKEQKRYLAGLSDDEQSAEGEVEAWSPKDTVAHVAHWDFITMSDLADPDNHEPSRDEDFNKTNARIWERYKDWSWEEIEALIESTHEDLMKHLRRIKEEEISDPDRYEWTNGRPLWRSVAFTTFYHALQHVAVLYAGKGDLEYANQLQEHAAEMQMRLSDSNDWRGSVLYNLGCHYAMTGQEDAALAKIEAGIELYPVLRSWAPDDPDLASLHEKTAFLNLIREDPDSSD